MDNLTFSSNRWQILLRQSKSPYPCYFNDLIQVAIIRASSFGTCGIGGISVA
jgi:hypothetical protein